MQPLGFYPVVNDEIMGDHPLCVACAPSDPPAEWEPIFYDSEADTPTHCSECEALIEHSLTTDGYAYVSEAIADHLDRGAGRVEIIEQWINAYSDIIA